LNTDVDHNEPILEPEGPRRRPRRCIATRLPADRAGLVRFVIGPDDRLVPDLDARLPGRGLWLSADAERLKTALSRNLFAKVARRRVVVDDDLPTRLDALLTERCLQRLGLARRAGALEIGFEQVAPRARSGALDVLVVANDAGADGRAKLAGGRRVRGWVSLFTRAEMGSAVGRDALVYAGVHPGSFADRLMEDARRLAGLRGETASVLTPPMEMIETA
jgi:hypothetical protein